MRHLNFKYLFRLCAHTDTTLATFFNPRNRRRRWVDWAVEERVTMLQNFLVDMLCALCGSTAVFSFLFSDFSAPLSLFLVALMLRHLFDNRRVGKRARERGKIDKICFQTLTTRLGVNCTVSIVLSERTWTHKTYQCCAKKRDSWDMRNCWNLP